MPMSLETIRPRPDAATARGLTVARSEEHTSELQSLRHLVCRLLLEKKKIITKSTKNREKNKKRKQGNNITTYRYKCRNNNIQTQTQRSRCVTIVNIIIQYNKQHQTT